MRFTTRIAFGPGVAEMAAPQAMPLDTIVYCDVCGGCGIHSPPGHSIILDPPEPCPKCDGGGEIPFSEYDDPALPARRVPIGGF